MGGNCVCIFARNGKCEASDEYLCPMEHDVEGLIVVIEQEIVDNLNGKRNDICTISTIGDLIIEYKSRQRGE